jgi:hypothetical protein
MGEAVLVPLIYSPRIPVVRMSLAARALSLAIGLGCLAILMTASRLTPSPTGIGTHRALGLERCAFEQRTGLPCPACGMTTSFAWFVRGNIPASFYIQPMGTLLAVLAVIAFWTGLYAALTGRAAYRLVLFIPGRYYLVPLLSCAVIAWAWKIFIHLHGIDGWR